MGALTHNGDVINGLPSIASQINYDNTSSGMAATQVQDAVDELNSNKQPKTDNNLQTTSKETTGAINELKSGLTGVSSNAIAESGVTFAYSIIHKVGKIATINLISDSAENTISCQPWGSVTIGTIPDGFRPEYLTRLTTKISTGTAWIDVIFSISPNGNITLDDAINGEGFTLKVMVISTAYICE